jgi:hypothetical protein
MLLNSVLREAQLDYLGNRYSIVRVAPEPFGGLETGTSTGDIMERIAAQHIGIRCCCPGYPPTLRCRSPERMRTREAER